MILLNWLSRGRRFWHLRHRYSCVVNNVVLLPTCLVSRYRAVDREVVGSALVDSPAHLEQLTVDIEQRGILVPLALAFNSAFATLDGNHRIAVALRLDFTTIPVALHRLPISPRPDHAKAMDPGDHLVLVRALGAVTL